MEDEDCEREIHNEETTTRGAERVDEKGRLIGYGRMFSRMLILK